MVSACRDEIRYHVLLALCLVLVKGLSLDLLFFGG